MTPNRDIGADGCWRTRQPKCVVVRLFELPIAFAMATLLLVRLAMHRGRPRPASRDRSGPGALDATIRRRQPVPMALIEWADGLTDELRFWDRWLATGGLDWPADYARRFDPEAALQPHLASFLTGRPEARVLDVGAGPVTAIGYRRGGQAVALTAIDPLAPLYAALLRRHGKRPPITTGFGLAEALTLTLPTEHFDLVHCCNALDHAIDPLAGLAEMLAVARIGGRVVLSHFTDEAEAAGRAGLHQWNFAIRAERFVIWNRAGAIDVAGQMLCPCQITIGPGPGVEVMLEKLGPAPPDPTAGSRLAGVLETLIGRLGASLLPA